VTSNARLEWDGDQLLANVAKAAAAAINDVTKAAADDAQATHDWFARRGRRGLEGQIEHEPATVDGTRVTGRFGYTKRRGFYGLFHEEGTVHEHEHPALRPAGDRHFPALTARISERLK
jgi:hypothetical protein